MAKPVDGVRVRGWLYADQLRPIAELDGAGHVISRFVHASRVNVPDYCIRGGALYKIVSDRLGSPRIVLDAVTAVVDEGDHIQVEYDPEWRKQKTTKTAMCK